MRYCLASIAALSCCLVIGPMRPVSAAEATDSREAVSRTEAETVFVHEQMRLLLAGIAGIEEGLGSGNMDQVAHEAAARGRKANVTLARPPGLAAKESEAWKSMFTSVRTGFDEIADQATAHAPAATINKTLANTMTNCVACHQTYRISVEGR